MIIINNKKLPNQRITAKLTYDNLLSIDYS